MKTLVYSGYKIYFDSNVVVVDKILDIAEIFNTSYSFIRKFFDLNNEVVEIKKLTKLKKIEIIERGEVRRTITNSKFKPDNFILKQLESAAKEEDGYFVYYAYSVVFCRTVAELCLELNCSLSQLNKLFNYKKNVINKKFTKIEIYKNREVVEIIENTKKREVVCNVR